MQKLQCPSCGANLELPEGLTVAHCIYCGNKVVLRGDDALNEMVNLKRFLELAQVAMQAQHYDDAIKYSNKVLEIDTKNIEAWIIKAEAEFWLSTPHDDKFGSAMQYLETALHFQPNDERILEARSRITKNYSLWLNQRGLDALKHAREIYNIYIDSYASGMLDLVQNTVKAKDESRTAYGEAMTLFLAASNHYANNIVFLQNIRVCASEANWISWTDVVLEKIRIINSLEGKQIAENNIVKIEKALAEVNAKLKAMEGKSGFWAKATRGDLEDEVKSLEIQLKKEKAKIEKEIPI